VSEDGGVGKRSASATVRRCRSRFGRFWAVALFGAFGAFARFAAAALRATGRLARLVLVALFFAAFARFVAFLAIVRFAARAVFLAARLVLRLACFRLVPPRLALLLAITNPFAAKVPRCNYLTLTVPAPSRNVYGLRTI
jgi:hypothetical protein